MAVRRLRGRGIVCEHLVQRADLARVHVGCTGGNAPKRGGLEGAQHLLVPVRQEAQLRTLLRVGIAVGTQAIERVLLDEAHTEGATHIGRQLRHRGHAGVVEMVVRQQRAIVAVDALALAEEETQTRNLVLREKPRRGEVTGGESA